MANPNNLAFMFAAMTMQQPQVVVSQHQRHVPHPQIPSFTCHCGRAASRNVKNFIFCSNSCRSKAFGLCAGASIIMKHRYMGKEICDIVGRDKNRHENPSAKGVVHGLETFGGGGKHGEDPRDIAIREAREESGIDLDEKKLKAHLDEAPLHIQSFIAKNSGKQKYYFTYIVHITSMSTGAMTKAWKSRYAKYKKGMIAYDSVEMDKFYHVRIGSAGFWKDHKDNRIGHAAAQVKICGRDRAIMDACARDFSWVVDTPSLNSLGIVNASKTYLM